IPVYFFLTVLFEAHDYRGPYNNVNKGLLMLYYLVENKSTDDMEDFIPKKCIALDGGYSNSVKHMIENTNLNIYNFIFPIRKQINVDLNNNEIDYNLKFGGFRSKIEKIFADIGDNFKRLNNEKPIKTSNINNFNIQYKIGCLLLNIKNFVQLLNIEIQNEHQKWLHNDFDFP
ncbi:hypothetical protein K501DRAFT_124504, partial [Backusella circina FSU 941]